MRKKLMQKITLMISIIVLMINTSLAYTLTLQHSDKGLVITTDAGKEIILEKAPQYKVWKVISGGVTIIDNKFIMPERDVVLKALSEYQINYDANGGINAPETQEKGHGENIILSSNIPTREGYIFLGWNTKSDGSGTNYNAGETYTIDESITLYAKWQIEETEPSSNSVYTITTISDTNGNINGIYTNHRCSVCGGIDHECEEVNIIIKTRNAKVTLVQ